MTLVNIKLRLISHLSQATVAGQNCNDFIRPSLRSVLANDAKRTCLLRVLAALRKAEQNPFLTGFCELCKKYEDNVNRWLPYERWDSMEPCTQDQNYQKIKELAEQILNIETVSNCVLEIMYNLFETNQGPVPKYCDLCQWQLEPEIKIKP